MCESWTLSRIFVLSSFIPFLEQCGDTDAAVAPGTVTVVHVDDDEVITTNGLVVSAAEEVPETADRASVCSCSCYNLRSGIFRNGPRLAEDLPMFRRASPGIFSGSQTEYRRDKQQNLLETEDRVNFTSDNIFLSWGGYVRTKRASI